MCGPHSLGGAEARGGDVSFNMTVVTALLTALRHLFGGFWFTFSSFNLMYLGDDLTEWAFLLPFGRGLFEPVCSQKCTFWEGRPNTPRNESVLRGAMNQVTDSSREAGPVLKHDTTWAHCLGLMSGQRDDLSSQAPLPWAPTGEFLVQPRLDMLMAVSVSRCLEG